MKISVIIPVYNGEKTLSRAVISVLNQNYKNIEIIIVNDGSSDNTSLICNKFKKEYSNIIILDQENQGLSYSRNNGIKHSTGDYIMFLDSDDDLEDNAISILTQRAKNYDIVCGNINFIINNQVFKCFDKFGTRDINYGSKNYNIIKTESIFGYSCAKLYKKDFLIKNNLFFHDSKQITLEDTLFNIECFNYNPKYLFINKSIYNYYRNQYYLSADKNNFELIYKSINLLKTTIAISNKPDLYIPLISRVFAWCMMKSKGLKNFNRCCNEYFNSKEINEALKNNNVNFELEKLQSKSQLLFFKYCMFALKCKSKLLLSVFLITKPLMIAYLKHSKVRI